MRAGHVPIHLLMRVFTAVLGFAFAIYLFGLRELEPPQALTAPIIASYFLLPLALGFLAGWWALPLVATSFVAGALAYQILVWTDDPQLSGIDDLPPISGIVFILPFALLFVAHGAALR